MKNANEKVIKNIPPAPAEYKVVFGAGLPVAINSNFQKRKPVLETL